MTGTCVCCGRPLSVVRAVSRDGYQWGMCALHAADLTSENSPVIGAVCDWTDARTDPACWATPPRGPSLHGTWDVITHPGMYGAWWLHAGAVLLLAVLYGPALIRAVRVRGGDPKEGPDHD